MKWVSKRGCVKWVVNRVFVALRCAEEGERIGKAGEGGKVGRSMAAARRMMEWRRKRRRRGKQRARRAKMLFIHSLPTERGKEARETDKQTKTKKNNTFRLPSFFLEQTKNERFPRLLACALLVGVP